jgi:DNA ligase-associated metallophosphoesterase
VSRTVQLSINGVELLADPSGALYWPARRVLVVADLHFEKGSAHASRGRFLPPYDTAATLEALAAAIARHRPACVICLGDSFHDDGAAERLAPDDCARLSRLASDHDWIWIAGNHDPAPPAGWGGRVAGEVTLGALTFRHQGKPGPTAGEISGHYHPKAAVRTRAGRIAGRCFVGDRQRLVLPAFGAYTGGLDVRDAALAGLFPNGFTVRLLGRAGVYSFSKTALERR